MSGEEEEPGARAPAPDPLRVVQLFINTNDIEAQRDSFDTPGAVKEWLRIQGLGDHTVSESDRRRLVALREALRASLRTNNGAPVDHDAFATINAELDASRSALRIDASGPTLRTDRGGTDAVVGALLAIVFDAMLDGTWSRLKACRRDICEWVFYDHSRNRSGTWCAMNICGNRTKTSAYWRRRRERPS